MKKKWGDNDTVGLNSEKIKFEDLIKPEEIQELQDLFSETTGVAIAIFSPEGSLLSKPSNFSALHGLIKNSNSAHLTQSDLSSISIGTKTHIFLEKTFTIEVKKTHLANLYIGHVLTEAFDDELNAKYANFLKQDKSEIMALSAKLPIMNEEKFNKISKTFVSLIQAFSTKSLQNSNYLASTWQDSNVEIELLESEGRYESLFNNNHSVMLLIEPETGKIVDANIAATKYYGWSLEEICSKNISEINTLSKEEIIAEMGKAMKEKRNHFFFKHRLSTNEIRDVEVFSGPINVRNSILLYSLIHDISEGKKAEVQLRVNEERLKYALDGATDGLWDWDVPTNHVFYSKKWKAMLGYSETEIGTSLDEWSSRVHPDDLNRVMAEVNRHINGETPSYENEHRIKCKDGSYKWIMDIGQVVSRDKEGRPLRAIGTHKDINERKNMELELLEFQVLQKAVFDSTNDLIWSVNCNDFGLLTFNDALYSHLNSTQDVRIEKGTTPKQIFKNEAVVKIWHDLYQRAIDEGEYSTEYSTVNGINILELNFTTLIRQGEMFGIVVFAKDITQKKEAEIALLKSEEKFRTIFENMLDVYYEASLDGVILEISPSIDKLSRGQYKRTDLIGNLIVDFYAIDQQRTDFFEEINKHGRVTDYQLLLNNKDGSFIPVAITSGFTFDGEGKPIKIIGSIRDISERNNSEKELKAKTLLLSNLIINLQEGILLEDVGRNIAITNQLFCDMFKIPAPPELLVGSNCSESAEQSKNLFVNPEKFVADIDTILTNKIAIYNQELALADGRYLERDYIPNYVENVYNGHLWKYRDITARKLVEIELRKLSLAIEQSPVVTYITNVDGFIEYANPKCIELTGYSKSEIIGKNPRIFSSKEKGKDFYKHIWNTILSGNDWQGEFHNKKKNGELFWVIATISPVVNTNGVITHFLAIQEDITERKISENEIKELNANLELTIEKRTAELSETNKSLLKEIEERTKIEKKLVESREQLDLVIKGSNDAPWDWNLITDTKYYSLKWWNQLGYEPADIPIDNSIGESLTHPDDTQHTNDVLKDALESGKNSYEAEFRLLHKNGYYVPVLSRGFISKNDSGIPVRITGTNMDLTERKNSDEFGNELLHLSVQMTGIIDSELSEALNMALEKIGKLLSADRAYIFELNPLDNTMSNTYEWCNIGINPEISNLQSIPVEVLPSWMEALRRNENIIIPLVKDLPDSWTTEREILEPQGIQSLIVIPIFNNNQLIGFVGLDAVNNPKEYSSTEISNLRVWSNMLAGIINKHRIDQTLNQTRQNYETFFNTIDDFLFVLNEQGNIIHINTTVTNRLGYTNQELIDKSVLMVHPVDRRDEAGRIVGEMLAGTADFCPVPLLAKDNRQLPVETKVKAGFWDGQAVIFGVSKDISKIKLSEEKFATAFRSNSAMMSISSFENGKYIDINNEFEETLGYSRNETIGKTNRELGLFVDQDLASKIVDKLRKSIAVRKKEVQLITKSGEIRTAVISCDSIFIGEERCVLTVAMDISDRKKAEEEIRKARKEAERANLAKSEFLSRMSHELRTPMNSILGFAQLLNMGVLAPPQKLGVNHILRSGKHLLDLINEVLEISRIEAGHLTLVTENVPLNRTIHEMMDIVQPQLSDGGISLHFDNSEDNRLHIKTDVQRFKQVLLNLLNNAIKYNKVGGTIEVKTEIRPQSILGHTPIRISIKDSGIGIKQEDIPKLYTPFERIGAEKTSTEGTGLGLSVVKKLMEAMNGELGVESVVGVGSTFWIELPIVENTLLVDSAATSNQNIELEIIKKIGTILYIEDTESNIELVEQILVLQRPGILLQSNSSGKKAIELAKKIKPDVILLDLNLPDLDGQEVLKLLKSDDATKDIPVVVVSADAMPLQLKKLLKAGAKKYLTKPLDIIEFLKTIDEYINNETV